MFLFGTFFFIIFVYSPRMQQYACTYVIIGGRWYTVYQKKNEQTCFTIIRIRQCIHCMLFFLLVCYYLCWSNAHVYDCRYASQAVENRCKYEILFLNFIVRLCIYMHAAFVGSKAHSEIMLCYILPTWNKAYLLIYLSNSSTSSGLYL